MWLLTTYHYAPFPQSIDFLFWKKKLLYPSLMLIGLLYNLGIWIDKFMFWYYPDTSEQIIGPLRASVIYDLPVFMAYLSIIPGMAVFLVRIETDFVDFYDFASAIYDSRNEEKLIFQYRHNISIIGIFYCDHRS